MPLPGGDWSNYKPPPNGDKKKPEGKPPPGLNPFTDWTAQTSGVAPTVAPASPYAPTQGTSLLETPPMVDFDVELGLAAPATWGEGAQGLLNPPGNPQLIARGIEDPAVTAAQEHEKFLVESREARKEADLSAKQQTRDRTYELTWDQYNALSPQQKAAIDFNTQLVSARQKDLTVDYDDPGKKEEKRYNISVKQMFGQGDGSRAFAPETVALLQQINFKGVEEGIGSDLDDFLGLKTAISLGELNKMGLREEDPILSAAAETPAQTQAFEVQDQLADRTAALQRSMAKAHTLIQDFNSSMLQQRNKYLNYFGAGVPNKVETQAGWGDDEDSMYFQRVFDLLADKDVDADEVLKDFNTQIPQGDKRRKMFYDYATTMAQRGLDYNAKLGLQEGVKYRDPKPFLEILNQGGVLDASQRR